MLDGSEIFFVSKGGYSILVTGSHPGRVAKIKIAFVSTATTVFPTCPSCYMSALNANVTLNDFHVLFFCPESAFRWHANPSIEQRKKTSVLGAGARCGKLEELSGWFYYLPKLEGPGRELKQSSCACCGASQGEIGKVCKSLVADSVFRFAMSRTTEQQGHPGYSTVYALFCTLPSSTGWKVTTNNLKPRS